MTRDRNDMVFNPPHDTKKVNGSSYQTLGIWNGDTFSFLSPQHERDWRRQAYRQSVHDDRWQAQPPVDHRTQTLLDDKPEIGEGQFYRGPDGKHRRKTIDQREDADVQAIRRTAFDNYARSGVTWTDLADYGDDKPHPGEEEAMALSQAKTGTETADQELAWPNKTRDMGVLPTNRHAITQFTGNLGLGLDQLADPWDEGSGVTTPPDILVASNYQGTAPAMPRNWVTEPSFGSPKKPITPAKSRRDFVEGLIGHPANDNVKPAAGTNIKAHPESKLIGQVQPSSTLAPRTGMTAEEVAEAEYVNGLFNWQRQGKPAPAPKEYAIHAISDEGRFSYLEEMKDEWSRFLEAKPEKVLISMQGEMEKLSVAAQRDFFSAHHRMPTPQELAEINNTVEKIVFGPAEHWTESSKSPDQRNKDGEAKPYLMISDGAPVSAEEAFSIVEEIFDRAVLESKRTGKAGNATTQRHVPILAEKMLAELKRCGIEVSNDAIKYEKQIKIHRGNKGARWGDFRIEFRANGKTFALDVNHSAYLRSRYSRTPGEQAAFTDIVSFRRINVNGGEFADSEGAAISFPKIGKRQSEEEYLKQMDDFLKDLVDCKSPVKVRVTNPYDVQLIQRGQGDAANDG